MGLDWFKRKPEYHLENSARKSTNTMGLGWSQPHHRLGHNSSAPRQAMEVVGIEYESHDHMGYCERALTNVGVVGAMLQPATL